MATGIRDGDTVTREQVDAIDQLGDIRFTIDTGERGEVVGYVRRGSDWLLVLKMEGGEEELVHPDNTQDNEWGYEGDDVADDDSRSFGPSGRPQGWED